MRLYFPYDSKISRAMERIRRAFIAYSPPGTLFVDNMETDVVHCLNWVGQNPREHTARCEIVQGVPTLPLGSKYIVFVHVGNPHYRDLDSYYQRILAGALLVVTYDREILGYEGSNVLETPWGFEPTTFYREPRARGYKILATGYVAESEAIDACFDACLRLQAKLCHVGGLLRAIPRHPCYDRYEGISDSELRDLYNSSEYVSGMRREGGFELPVLEGYACGCRPIVFEQPTMRKWYNDFAIFVPNLPRGELVKILVDVLRQPTNLNPRPDALEKFHWKQIIARVWISLLEGSR